ncbi:serpin family protein [Planotetraspora thailandica]|nr:serpin family protein [Planotetraspora thailandica]
MVINGGSHDPVTAANAMTARWAANCSGESVVLAGVGAWILLAYLASAAEGRGRTELQEAVGMNAEVASRGAQDVLTVLNGSPAINSALGLWTSRKLPLQPAWTAALPGGARGELTGNPTEDQLRLDAWASGQTGGLIPTMPVSLTEETLLVLAGALTVRTTWLRPFIDDVELPRTGPWAGREIHALRRVTRILDRATVIDGPSGRLTMLRVMGTGGIDVRLVLGEESRKAGEVLRAGIEALSGRHPAVKADALPIGESAPGMTVRSVRSYDPGDFLSVTVPRFTVASSHDLLGLPAVFGLDAVTDRTRGHFPGISTEPLAVSQARQDAVATFNASGFEAAAVTAVGAIAAGIAPPPPHRVKNVDVEFSRPFGFLAVDRRSGLVLTAGWVAEPEDLAYLEDVL